MIKNYLKSAIFSLGVVFIFVLLPKVASAATLYLSPGSGNFGVGSTITVTVGTNTQGAAVNTAEARISFSSNLELVSVKQGATFYLSSPGSPQKGSGTVYFGGGLPTPGYSGSSGVLGIMTFRARAEGVATVSVDSGKVLLNDGLGTDALTSSSSARYNITPPPVGAVSVTSDTHPNPDAWYTKKDVNFSWNRPSQAFGFSFDFDQDPNTVPDSTLDTTITTTKSYTDLKDGIWYFHIKARPESPSSGFGATTHFKIQIDTATPKAFDIKVAESTVTFEATDEGSGIDHYEISVDGKIVEPSATSPYTLFGLKNGDHQIAIKAYDKAGNSVESHATMNVHGVTIGFFQRSLQVPMYMIAIGLLLIVILFILVLWLLMHKKRSRVGATGEMSKLQSELDELKAEYAAAASLNKKISKTKRNIENKLTKIKKAR
jgi:hypothetical protein